MLSGQYSGHGRRSADTKYTDANEIHIGNGSDLSRYQRPTSFQGDAALELIEQILLEHSDNLVQGAVYDTDPFFVVECDEVLSEKSCFPYVFEPLGELAHA